MIELFDVHIHIAPGVWVLVDIACLIRSVVTNGRVAFRASGEARGGDEGLREIFRDDASFVDVIAM